MKQHLQAIAATGTLADLRWPNHTDSRYPVVKLHEDVNYAPA